MKIACLSIFISKYTVFWDDYYKSFIEKFYKNYEPELFVFTDSRQLIESSFHNVTFIKVADEGWPNNSMNRFKFFSQISEQLSKFDFIYFFQSNAKFMINFDINLIDYSDKIIAFQHPLSLNTNPIWFPLERSRHSRACVKFGEENQKYAQAAAFGGPSSLFIKMTNQILDLQLSDQAKNIIPIWIDESYFNKWLTQTSEYIILSHEYIYPETHKISGEIKVLMRDKSNFFDIKSFKNNEEVSNNLSINFKSKLKAYKLKFLVYYFTIFKFFRRKI